MEALIVAFTAMSISSYKEKKKSETGVCRAMEISVITIVLRLSYIFVSNGGVLLLKLYLRLIQSHLLLSKMKLLHTGRKSKSIVE